MMDVFCANGHLILKEDRCPVCDWPRPAVGDGGTLVWGPIQLPGALGRPGIAKVAVNKKTVIVPLRDGKMIGLNTSDGSPRWEFNIGQGLYCQDIQPDGKSVLCAISDIRLPGQSGKGFLARISHDGTIAPVWQADTSQISSFTLTEDRLYLRTARPELFAFAREEIPVMAWKTNLEAWSSNEPVLVGERIIIPDGLISSDFGHFKLVQTNNGAVTRHTFKTTGLMQLQIATHEGSIFFRHGRRSLAALDPDQDEPKWIREFPKLYTSPIVGNDAVFIVTRRTDSSDTEHRYQLTCLNTDNGESVWETPLSERVSLNPVCYRNLLLTGSEKGLISAFDSHSGNLLWQERIGDGSAPIQTRLVCSDGLVIAGNQKGELAAIALGLAQEPTQSPEDLVASGAYEAAAAAFALNSQYKEAAAIYQEHLEDFEKAIRLLEYGKHYSEAVELAQEMQQNTLALSISRKAGDAHAEALILIRMGDTLKAAQILEEVGELEHAAQLFEQSGENQRAINLYKELNQVTNVARLSELVSGPDESIAFLESVGRTKEAAVAAEKHGRLRKAIDLYRKATLVEEEYRVLKQLTETNPREWSLERLTELAGIFKDHQIAARAWDQLERPSRAAFEYRAAAEALEKDQASSNELIGELYEFAMQRFEEAGLSKDRLACREKVIFYRELPDIVVRARMDDKFREDELNKVTFEIENTGHGLAIDVRITIGGDRFEVDESTGSPHIERLGIKVHELHTTYLRPKLRQIGTVPLQLNWTWLDRKGNRYENKITKAVSVRKQDASDVSKPGEIELRPVEEAISQVFKSTDLGAPVKETALPARPIKVLYLAANPANLAQLNLDAELRDLQNMLATIPQENEIDIEYRPAVQPGDLQQLLLREKPDIVHFSGHGSPSGAIYLQDSNGESHPVSSKSLSDLFGLITGNIRLVVLNACFSETQANAIAEHIDCVIGMSNDIEDEAARTFSEALYRGIGYGTDLETAFNLGCNAIDIENLDDVLVPKILAHRKEPSRICFFPK